MSQGLPPPPPHRRPSGECEAGAESEEEDRPGWRSSCRAGGRQAGLIQLIPPNCFKVVLIELIENRAWGVKERKDGLENSAPIPQAKLKPLSYPGP